MSSASKTPSTLTSELIAAAAANADRYGEGRQAATLGIEAHGLADTLQTRGIDTTGGWNAYDVWRRFIKEAREQRQSKE